MKRILGVALGLLLLAPFAAAQAPAHILIVTGANNHDWRFTSEDYKRLLEETRRFRVTITRDPARDLARLDLTRFQAMLLDYNGPRWGEKPEKRFLAAVRGGVGVVVLHAADNAFPGWAEYERMVGDLWRRGKTSHGRFHPFDVEVIDRNHPITAGLPAFKAHPDELYHHLVHTPGVKTRVLMRAFSTKESGGSGRYEPMAIVLNYGKGRVFHSPLGHVWKGVAKTRVSLADPQFRVLVIKAVEWAATGACTLGPGSIFWNVPVRPGQRPVNHWLRRLHDDGPLLAALDPHIMLLLDAANGGLMAVWAGRADGSFDDIMAGRAGKPWMTREAGEPAFVVHADGSRDRLRLLDFGESEDGRARLRLGVADEPVLTVYLEHWRAGEPSLHFEFEAAGLAPGERIEWRLPSLDLGGLRFSLKGKGRVRGGRIVLTAPTPVHLRIVYPLDGGV